jgi:hypothetical protein
MAATSRIVRPLRISVVVMTVAASVAVLGTGTAHASSSGTFIACADANSTAAVSIAGGGCTSLATALSAAAAYGTNPDSFGGSATVELMPGDYCPVTIPTEYYGLTLVGVGAAGLAAANYSGPEADLSSFDLGTSSCGGGSAPDFALNAPGDAPSEVGNLSLENLGFNGSAAGGPTNGINAFDTNVSMKDVLVENFAQTGLSFSADSTFRAYQAAKLSVTNSAFTNNGTALYARSGNDDSSGGSIYDSMMAGNQTGLDNAGTLNLVSNTISHNTTDGVDESNTSNPSGQSLYNIVADNATDCAGLSGAFEPSGGFNGDNLVDSTCTGSVTAGYPDQTAGTVAAVALVPGAPTPSIVPPSEAIGEAAGDCGDEGEGTRTDQIEDLVAPAGSCDIGSIQSQNVTPFPDLVSSDASVDAGSVPINQTFGHTIYVGNSGGGLMGTSSVAVTGDSVFAVSHDSCTYQLIQPSQYAQQCAVTITATPSSVGDHNTGDLNVVTTAGTLDIQLTMHVVGPFTSPTDVAAAAGDQQATLSFTPPQNPTEPITGYDVQQSDDGGQSWGYANAQFNSNGVPTSVTNLDNGTPYEFEIAAQDQYGDGPWSDPTDSITPHAPSHPSGLTAIPARTVNYGKPATITTTLTDATTHAPIAGATVTLKVGSASGPGTTHITNSQGIATATIHPKTNAGYLWVFGGSAGHAAVSTRSTRVLVAQVVHAALSAKTVKHGKAVELYGTVSPNEKGQVVVSYYRPGNNKTSRLKATIKRQRLPNGKKEVGFLMSLTCKKKGTQTLHVSRAATSKNAAGVSKPLKLKVT